MPVICSRSTRLISSMRSCITRNAGTMPDTMRPSTMADAGIDTTSTPDKPTSSRNARITPTTMVIGAEIAIVLTITTSI